MPQASAQKLEEYTAFDLFMGEKSRGIATAKYSMDGHVQFDDPQEVARLMNIDRQDLIAELLPLFSGVIASQRSIAKVGSISMDLSVFQAKIILDGRFFVEKSLDDQEFVIQTKHSAAFKFSPRFIYSSDANGGDYYTYALNTSYGQGDFSFTHRELLQYGEARDSRELSYAKFNYVKNDMVASLGYLNTIASLLMPSEKIFGVSMGTEQLLLKNSDDLRGSKLVIYVPIRSRVNFFRENIMIDSQVLSQGRQEVDTSKFPQGSYFVDVVIENASGLDARKRVYYAKSGYLVPRGFPQVHIELGRKRDYYRILDDNYYQIEYKHRLSDVNDVTVASFGNEYDQTYILGTTVFYDDNLLFASTSWNKDSNIGIGLGLSGYFLGINLGFDYERSDYVSSQAEYIPSLQPVVDPSDQIFPQEVTRLVNRERMSFMTAKHFDKTDLRYQFSTIKEHRRFKQKMHAVWVKQTLLEDNGNSLYAEAGFQRDFEKTSYFIGVNWQARKGPYSLTNSGTERFGDFAQKTSIRNSLAYADMHPRSNIGSRVNINHQLDWASHDNYTDGLSGEYDHGFSYGDINLGTTAYKSPISSSGSRRVGFGTSLIVGGGGQVALAPSDMGESTLVVRLDNFDEGAATDVLLDGQASRSIKGSGKVSFSLAPYQTYKVRIAPSSRSALVAYDTHEEEVTLFPGQVHFAAFKIAKVYIALGRLKDANGRLIRNREISTESGKYYVEDDGAFQVELQSGETMRIQDRDLSCMIRLPHIAKIEYYYDYGDVVCR